MATPAVMACRLTSARARPGVSRPCAKCPSSIATLLRACEGGGVRACVCEGCVFRVEQCPSSIAASQSLTHAPTRTLPPSLPADPTSPPT